jgi:hypothetical protein
MHGRHHVGVARQRTAREHEHRARVEAIDLGAEHVGDRRAVDHPLHVRIADSGRRRISSSVSLNLRTRYYASGVGFSVGGSIPNVPAVIQVIEKLPVNATSATRLSSPIVFSAAA